MSWLRIRRRSGEPAIAPCLCVIEAPCNTPSVSDAKKILDAHVKFELARWTGDARNEQIADEVDAAFTWLSTVRLNQLFTSAELAETATKYSQQYDVTDELLAMIGAAARSAYMVASKDQTRIKDVVPVDSYRGLASAVIDMQDLREEITRQITTSEVYSKLMGHVVYQGIKNYLQAENVFARKLPGASALMKMGQSAINSAAPKLEQAVDKQLAAFVNANIQDNIRESKQYMDKVLDERALKAVAAELWDKNADLTFAELTSLIPVDVIDEVNAAGRQSWLHVRAQEFFSAVVGRVIDDFLKENGKRKVTDILADAGITKEFATDIAIDIAGPIIDKAVADGFLEARIRARLEPFYTDYFG